MSISMAVRSNGSWDWNVDFNVYGEAHLSRRIDRSPRPRYASRGTCLSYLMGFSDTAQRFWLAVSLRVTPFSDGTQNPVYC